MRVNRGDVVLVTETTPEDLQKYAGTLKGKWILTQAAPDVAATMGLLVSPEDAYCRPLKVFSPGFLTAIPSAKVDTLDNTSRL